MENKPTRLWVFFAIPILIGLIAFRFVNGPLFYQDVSLLNAIADNDMETVAKQLDSGADIEMQDIRGYSALHQTKNPDMAEFLINNGADMNVQNKKGETPLHESLQWQNLEVAELLIKNGANLNIKNNLGLTALDLAKISIQPNRMTEMIVKRGGKTGEKLKAEGK